MIIILRMFKMIFERVKSRVVAHISYFLGSEDEAVVIDPRRDCQVYIDIAKREEVKIKYIFETHRNEDYVVGSRELAHNTGGKIFHGPGVDFKYGDTLKDGQEFYFGKLKVTAIHTPGHTPESMSYAIADLESGDQTFMVFTGDALFVNDVGRTDFGGPEKHRQWAEDLYNSIFNKLLPLGDGVILCPAHGAGSVCGGEVSEREYSTLGLERLTNPVLQKTREEFIEHKVSEHHDIYPYFSMMEKYNLEGAPFLGFGPNPPPLKPEEFLELVEQGAIVIDTRSPPAFGGAHIKGSYSIPLRRLSIGGWVLPYDKQLLLVLEDGGKLDYVAISLARMGYDLIEGYLIDGIVSWYKASLPLEPTGLLTVQELKERLDQGEDWLLLDVRSKSEFLKGYIEGILHISLGLLERRIEELPKDRQVAVICKTGTRASLGSSILLRGGLEKVYNVLGGMEAWQKAGYQITM